MQTKRVYPAARRTGFAKRLLATACVLGCGAPVAEAASLSLSTSAGPPGRLVTARAVGFGAEEEVEFRVGTTLVATELSDASGEVLARLRIPRSQEPGVVNVRARGDATRRAGSRAFTVRTDWTQWAGNAAHTGYNRYENVLTSSTVEELELLWTRPTGNSSPTVGAYSAPVSYGSYVYVGSSDRRLYAIRKTTGTIGWRTDVLNGKISMPAASAGLIVFGDTAGIVYAFRHGQAAPAWYAGVTDPVVQPPVIDGSRVFITAGSRVLAFPLACTGNCAPLWTGELGPGRLAAGPPTVAGGFVHLASRDASASHYRFPADCRSDGGICTNVSQPLYSCGAPVSGAVTAARGASFWAGDGHAWGGDPHQTSGLSSCLVTFGGEGVAGAGPGGVALKGGRLAMVAGGPRVYDLGCEAAPLCPPLWSRPDGGRLASSDLTTPLIAGDVLYVMAHPARQESIPGTYLTAYDVACGSGGATCRPRVGLSLPPQEGSASKLALAVTVSDGRVYVHSTGGLHAFGLPDD